MKYCILSVIPSDHNGLLVDFAGLGLRVFRPRDYFERQPAPDDSNFLSFPTRFRHLIWNDRQVCWPRVSDRELIWEGENIWLNELTLSSDQLYQLSRPIPESDLKFISYPLGMKNQAPTAEDARHHVFFVSLTPFSARPFCIGESIGGGHGERGGANTYSLDELMEKDRMAHFEASGCDWAMTRICQAYEQGMSQSDVIQQLIDLNGQR